jgi:hypothetical protein
LALTHRRRENATAISVSGLLHKYKKFTHRPDRCHPTTLRRLHKLYVYIYICIYVYMYICIYLLKERAWAMGGRLRVRSLL